MANNTYVLQSRDILGLPQYYAGNWNDTSYIEKATRYNLDEAMAQAKVLKEFGGHYCVVRVEK